MRTGDDALQVRDFDPGVALGRRERAVAEERLDVPDVGPAAEQMRRDTVAEGVTRHVLRDVRPLRPQPEAVVHDGALKESSLVAEEEKRDLGVPDELRPAVDEVRLDRLGRGAGQWNVTVFPTLALDDPKDMLVEVDVVGPEPGQLAVADPGSVERLEDRPVPEPDRRPLPRRRQDPPHLVLAQDQAREALLHPWKLERRRGVAEDQEALVEEAKEALDGGDLVRLPAERVRPVLSSAREKRPLVELEVLATHLGELDPPPGEPGQERADGPEVVRRRGGRKAQLELLAVEPEEPFGLRGHTALLASVAKWRFRGYPADPSRRGNRHSRLAVSGEVAVSFRAGH